MEKAEIRIECLKMVYRRDRHPDDSIRDARILENYVLEEFKESADKEVVSRDKTVIENPIAANRAAVKAKRIVGNP